MNNRNSKLKHAKIVIEQNKLSQECQHDTAQ